MVWALNCVSVVSVCGIICSAAVFISVLLLNKPRCYVGGFIVLVLTSGVASFGWLFVTRYVGEGELGGTAAVGKVENGHFFVGARGGRYVEVSERVWRAQHSAEVRVEWWMVVSWVLLVTLSFVGTFKFGKTRGKFAGRRRSAALTTSPD